jgi:hypothetical protein
VPSPVIVSGGARFARFRRAVGWSTAPGCLLFLILAFCAWVSAQEPPPAAAPPPPPPPANQQPTEAPGAASSSSNKHARNSHADDFLIIGTVFTDKAFAFPNVRLRVRRTAEKKFRWETYTNSRGEFAIRVPQGAEYEMVLIAKGYLDQSKEISAKSGISEDNVVFQMQPAAGGKK